MEKERIGGGRETASFKTGAANSILTNSDKQHTQLLGGIYGSRICMTALKH